MQYCQGGLIIIQLPNDDIFGHRIAPWHNLSERCQALHQHGITGVAWKGEYCSAPTETDNQLSVRNTRDIDIREANYGQVLKSELVITAGPDNRSPDTRRTSIGD